MAWQAPVYDRTYSDIANKTAKAYYNANDFNRIESNCEILANLLNVNITVKTNWTMTDKPTTTQLQRIVNNVALLRQNYHVYANCPQNPQMPVNNYNKANALERIMFDINDIYQKNIETALYTGTFYTGEIFVL